MSKSKVRPLYWIDDEVMVAGKIHSIRVNHQGVIQYELIFDGNDRPIVVIEEDIIDEAQEVE